MAVAKALLLMTLTILLISAAQFPLKKGMVSSSLFLLGVGLALLVAGFVCLRAALAKSELSIVFPFLACTYVLVALGSKMVFGEELVMHQWIGIACIVFGVSLLRRKL